MGMMRILVNGTSFMKQRFFDTCTHKPNRLDFANIHPFPLALFFGPPYHLP
jgi:hypothetical protein